MPRWASSRPPGPPTWTRASPGTPAPVARSRTARARRLTRPSASGTPPGPIPAAGSDRSPLRRVRGDLRVPEEVGDLDLRVLRAVGPVDGVLLHVGGEVLPDGAGGGVGRVG